MSSHVSGASPRQAVLVGLVVGYLAGSVSFSRVVGERAAPGADLNLTRIPVPELGTSVEFRGYTPTSVKEHAGTGPMLASLALEGGKALVPTLAMRLALPGTPAAPAAALGALVGHIFPMWSGFRGGYGMTPLLGGMAVLDPIGVAVTTGVVSGAIGATGKPQLMLAWPLTIPVWEAARGRPDLAAFGVAANAAYWARLVPELRRGMRGLVTTRRLMGSGPDEVASTQADPAEHGQQQAQAEQHGG